MIYDKENHISDLTEVPTIVYSVEYSMAFNNNNSEVGKLSWREGELKFTGNADDAAKLLFERLLKPYVDQYIAKELEQVKRERDSWKATAGHEADGLESWKKVAEKAEAELADLRGIFREITVAASLLLSELAEGVYYPFPVRRLIKLIYRVQEQAIKKAGEG